MHDVEIKFEREGVEGIVAVGSYLMDAAKRFGIRFEDECDNANDAHHCALIVSAGADNLSPLTSTETEHFAAHGRRSNERLACEAKIIKPGEIAIMTEQKKEETKPDETPKDTIHAEFESLPLEKKIASLLRMEAVTLSETFAYVVNSPMKVVEKVGDVIAEFGMKLEQEAKKASKPKDEQAKDAPKAKTAKPKAAAPKKPAAPEAPKA